MKRIPLLFLICSLLCVKVAGQRYTVYEADLTPYVGTWVYEHADTVFTIKLQLAKQINVNVQREHLYTDHCLVGGYSLRVKGIEIDNCIYELPSVFDGTKGILSYSKTGGMKAFCSSRNKEDIDRFVPGSDLLVRFNDVQKKHNGDWGILAGHIEVLFSDTLHWWLEDELKVYIRYEIDEPLKGYSVPTNAMMKRVKESGASR